MIISDLNYLETTELNSVEGGIGNVLTTQLNLSIIGQSSNAAAGNVAAFTGFNFAASGNNATVVQTNL